jgi:retinol dehydrogenase 12
MILQGKLSLSLARMLAWATKARLSTEPKLIPEAYRNTAAKKFAKMNPGRLILACRSQERGDEAVRGRDKHSYLMQSIVLNSCTAIKEATGCSTLECWTVDLANFKSVSAFVDRFDKEGGERLDILLENAGMATRNFHSTMDGWEDT